MKLIITDAKRENIELEMETPDLVSVKYGESFSPAQFHFFNDLFYQAFGLSPMWASTDVGVDVFFPQDMEDVYSRDRARAISCVPWMILLGMVKLGDDRFLNATFELDTPSMGFSGWVFDVACQEFGGLPSLRFEPCLGVTIGMTWDGEAYRYHVRKSMDAAAQGWLPDDIEELFAEDCHPVMMYGSMMLFRPKALRGALLVAWKRDLPFPPKAVLDVLRRSA